ncbi:hypothetical protein GCM10022226_49350 [Sphaerisporangium flaviroseum]|uniref:Uncharacterized protein n=1 Tax=Sphaerisporangium flaviroseum TaxID=509199 RepID=A0ABP7INX7_9ACTN
MGESGPPLADLPSTRIPPSSQSTLTGRWNPRPGCFGDEMIDEASCKMALVVAAKGRAAGLSREKSLDTPA